MARLRTWAYYWIDHQQPNGQFGAGYEDDIELVCGWPLLVLAQDDRKVRQSLQLLADGVWKSQPYLERFGYDRLTDVEHAAENISYSQPMMVVMDYDNPKWAARCNRSATTVAKYFLSRNEKGYLQFRSDYFGFDHRTGKPVTRETDRPFDIPQAAKALKPAMYAVWATHNADAKDVMLDYGRTWVNAVNDIDGAGRIKGMLPARIQWPSGQSVGTHPTLSSMRTTFFHLIGCYYLAGDESTIEPIRQLLRHTLVRWSAGDLPWVQAPKQLVRRATSGNLDERAFSRSDDEDITTLFEQLALIAILYRQATGDTQFDAHLLRWTERIRNRLVDGKKSYVLLNRNSTDLWDKDRPLTIGAYKESRCSVGAQLYLGWQLTRDPDYLAKLGWNLSSCLNDKWGAFTYWFYDKSELRVTSNDHLAHKIQYTESALCLMYLGGPAPVEAVWPRFDITWRDTGENFCALVHDGDAHRLRIQMYSFDQVSRKVTANLWELSPGRYVATIGPDANRDGRVDQATWQRTLDVVHSRNPRKPTTVQFSLAPGKLMVLQIEPE